MRKMEKSTMCSFCIFYSPIDFPLSGEEFTALTVLPAPLCQHLPPNRWLSRTRVWGSAHGWRADLPSIEISPFVLDPLFSPRTLRFSKVIAGNDFLCMGVVVALKETCLMGALFLWEETLWALNAKGPGQ